MAQLNEDSVPTALFPVPDLMPTFGFFEEHSLYADDYMSVLFEDCSGLTEFLEMTAPGCSTPLVHEGIKGLADAALLGFTMDESFGVVELELDLALPPTIQDLDPRIFQVPSDSATIPSTKSPQLVGTRERRTPVKRRKHIKVAKHSSQRQREEIQSLRVAAAQLELELKRILVRSSSREAAPVMITTVQPSSGNGGEEASVKQVLLWECVAKRQEVAKQRAERENAELRSELQSKIKVVKSLEQRLLRKRKKL